MFNFIKETFTISVILKMLWMTFLLWALPLGLSITMLYKKIFED